MLARIVSEQELRTESRGHLNLRGQSEGNVTSELYTLKKATIVRRNGSVRSNPQSGRSKVTSEKKGKHKSFLVKLRLNLILAISAF